MCIIYPIQQLRCIQYICIQIFESAAAVTLHVVYRKHLFTNVFFNKYFCVLDSINDRMPKYKNIDYLPLPHISPDICRSYTIK